MTDPTFDKESKWDILDLFRDPKAHKTAGGLTVTIASGYQQQITSMMSKMAQEKPTEAGSLTALKDVFIRAKNNLRLVDVSLDVVKGELVGTLDMPSAYFPSPDPRDVYFQLVYHVNDPQQNVVYTFFIDLKNPSSSKYPKNNEYNQQVLAVLVKYDPNNKELAQAVLDKFKKEPLIEEKNTDPTAKALLAQALNTDVKNIVIRKSRDPQSSAEILMFKFKWADSFFAPASGEVASITDVKALAPVAVVANPAAKPYQWTVVPNSVKTIPEGITVQDWTKVDPKGNIVAHTTTLDVPVGNDLKIAGTEALNRVLAKFSFPSLRNFTGSEVYRENVTNLLKRENPGQYVGVFPDPQNPNLAIARVTFLSTLSVPPQQPPATGK